MSEQRTAKSLVKRLRAASHGDWHADLSLAKEAADEIERLERETVLLTRTINQLLSGDAAETAACPHCDMWRARLARALSFVPDGVTPEQLSDTTSGGSHSVTPRVHHASWCRAYITNEREPCECSSVTRSASRVGWCGDTSGTPYGPSDPPDDDK